MANAEIQARYRLRHLEAYRRNNRLYYAKNRDRILSYHAGWREENKPRLKALDRIRYLRRNPVQSEGEVEELVRLMEIYPLKKQRRIP